MRSHALSPSDDLFEHLKRLASTPHDKYAEPVTSAMEYGWLVPDPGMKEERRWARKSSDITRNPANFARIEKKAEKTEKNAKA